MFTQIFHQATGQFFQIHHIILDGTGKSQMHTHLGIVKLGPQDTGSIQQFQRIVHRHPLLGTGHAGTVLRLGGLTLGYFVDKRRLTHIGDAQHHDTDGTAHLTFFGVGGQLFLQQFPHSTGELLRTNAALGIGFQHSIALLPEIGGPTPGLDGIGLIHTVEHHQAGLPCRHLIHIGITAGDGDAGVHDLTHSVHILDLGHDHPLGFCHMAGKPAQSFDLH